MWCNIVFREVAMTGQALETVRKRHGVSQRKAAKLLGLSQPMLSHIEKGKRNVSAEVASRLGQIPLRASAPASINSFTIGALRVSTA